MSESTNTEANATETGKPNGEASAGEESIQTLETRDEAARKVNRDLERKLKEAQARLAELEAANMTELERAQKEAADAKAEVEKLPNLVADHLRSYLVGIHGISDEDSDLYLTSNDPAVLLKQAAGIATRTTTTPKPDPTQGAQNALALNGDGLTEALARAVGAKP